MSPPQDSGEPDVEAVVEPATATVGDIVEQIQAMPAFIPEPGMPEAPGASNVSIATIEDQWRALAGISVSDNELVKRDSRRRSVQGETIAETAEADEESRTHFYVFRCLIFSVQFCQNLKNWKDGRVCCDIENIIYR